MNIPIQPIKYDELVEKAYAHYDALTPLDLRSADNEQALASWRLNIKYDLPGFSRQIFLLVSSHNLDEYVCVSGGDFDNLALVIDAAVQNQIVSIASDGTIQPQRLKTAVSRGATDVPPFIPDNALNQFPCDQRSVAWRARYIRERYPFAEQCTLGIIGEDDFLSLQFANDPAFQLTVIEKDQRIIQVLEDAATKNKPHIYEMDIATLQVKDAAIDTFITDPPYTLHGSLAFIHCGLSMMKLQPAVRSEFYVVLNPTMMGQHFKTLQQVLAQAGIAVTGVEQAVSHYKLPSNFEERARADDFLASGNVTKDALSYSSSSNLYRFSADAHSDLQVVRDFIQPEKDVRPL